MVFLQCFTAVLESLKMPQMYESIRAMTPKCIEIPRAHQAHCCHIKGRRTPTAMPNMKFIQRLEIIFSVRWSQPTSE